MTDKSNNQEQKMLNFLIDNLTRELSLGEMRKEETDEKRQTILKNNKILERAIFNGGIVDLINSGKTTVTELNTQPEELLNIIKDGVMKRAIQNNSISIGQLMDIEPQELDKATKLMKRNLDTRNPVGEKNFSELVKLLRLDESHAHHLQRTIINLYKEISESIEPINPPETPKIDKNDKPINGGYRRV